MSSAIADRHPAAPDPQRRRPHRAGARRLILAGTAAVAVVISVAAFLLISHYVL